MEQFAELQIQQMRLRRQFWSNNDACKSIVKNLSKVYGPAPTPTIPPRLAQPTIEDVDRSEERMVSASDQEKTTEASHPVVASDRLTSSPPHHLAPPSATPRRPPFYNPPVDGTPFDNVIGPHHQSAASPERRPKGPRIPGSPRSARPSSERPRAQGGFMGAFRPLRPQSAHTTASLRDWRHAAQSKLPVELPALDRVHTPWQSIATRWQLNTDQPWTNAVPVPSLFNPTPMRHALTNRPLPPGISYGKRRPYAKASMPAAVSTRATHVPGRLGWVQ